MTKCAMIVAFFSVFLLATTLSAQDFQVVTNSSNPVSSLSKEELGQIFLGKTKVWNGGNKVEPIDQVAGSVVRQRFSEDVLGKRTAAVVSYWQDQLFSGRAKPPPQLKSSAEVLEYVRSRPNAIGYVSKTTTMIAGVKVVKVFE